MGIIGKLKMCKMKLYHIFDQIYEYEINIQWWMKTNGEKGNVINKMYDFKYI